jgi:hypothetical protein
VNPRPSGKRRRPENDATAAILCRMNNSKFTMKSKYSSPLVDIVHDPLSFTFTVGEFQVFLHPIYEMILKSSLDKLVQDIRGDELVYIGTGEIICKWLERLDISIREN